MIEFNIECLVVARLERFGVNLTLSERDALVDYLVYIDADMSFNFDDFIVNSLRVIDANEFEDYSNCLCINYTSTRRLIIGN